jgi:hypothetical protein
LVAELSIHVRGEEARRSGSAVESLLEVDAAKTAVLLILNENVTGRDCRSASAAVVPSGRSGALFVCDTEASGLGGARRSALRCL